MIYLLANDTEFHKCDFTKIGEHKAIYNFCYKKEGRIQDLNQPTNLWK
jgi:hypothetical protein